MYHLCVVMFNDELQEVVRELHALKPISNNALISDLNTNRAKLLPSVVQAPKLELKELPNHLKYAYLGDGETLPIIISSKLSAKEEEKLIRVLREHKKAIGWTI